MESLAFLSKGVEYGLGVDDRPASQLSKLDSGLLFGAWTGSLVMRASIVLTIPGDEGSL